MEQWEKIGWKTIKSHQANHLILKTEPRQGIKCNYVYERRHEYFKTPVVCDFILLPSCARAHRTGACGGNSEAKLPALKKIITCY